MLLSRLRLLKESGQGKSRELRKRYPQTSTLMQKSTDVKAATPEDAAEKSAAPKSPPTAKAAAAKEASPKAAAPKAAGKAAAKKAPAKPIGPAMEEDVLPLLRSTLESEEGVSGLNVCFSDNEVRGAN